MERVGALTSRFGREAAARALMNGEGALTDPFDLRLRLAPEGWGLRKIRRALDEFGCPVEETRLALRFPS